MQWQQKLYHHTEEPPAETWERLKNELAQEPFLLRNQLDSFEEIPPADAWNKISIEIKPEEKAVIETPVRHISKLRIWAYAAVITTTILVITGLAQLIRNEGNGFSSSELSASISRPDTQVKKNQLSAPQVIYSDSNFILVSNQGGGYDRVSYKFNEMVEAMYGKNNSGNKHKQYWNSTLAKWKSKMEHSSFMPSGSNFFDMAEMISVLEEK